MRDLSESTLKVMLAGEQARLPFLKRGARPSREELETLDNFWNPHLHARRDWVPLVAILDREVQKLTTREACPVALALVRTRLSALMKLGLVGDEILEWSSGDIPGSAKLWLTNEGAAHFASSFPAMLRNPLLFAKRHLSLVQIVGVAITVTLAAATFMARILGWIG